MIEPQLVDYIKKAKAAGQQEEQTKNLLKKNGWTDSEITEAFSDAFTDSLPKQPQSTPDAVQAKPEVKVEHQISGQPSVNINAEVKKQSDPFTDSHPQRSGTRIMIFKIFAVVILLAIIGTGLYIALAQGDFAQKVIDKTFSYLSPKVEVGSNATPNTPTQNPAEPQPEFPQAKELASVLNEYNVSKISLIAFSESGDKTVFCAPSNSTGVISCFLNNQKFFDNPYAKKPYWMGVSPNGQRIVFLYYETAQKQSFIFENGVEVARYDGAVTLPVFSNDGTDFMFVVIANNGKSFVQLAEKKFSEHDKIITTPKWSDDGEYVFYGAQDGEKIFWVADKISGQSE